MVSYPFSTPFQLDGVSSAEGFGDDTFVGPAFGLGVLYPDTLTLSEQLERLRRLIEMDFFADGCVLPALLRG